MWLTGMRRDIQIGRPLNEVASMELSHPFDETVGSALKKSNDNFTELYSGRPVIRVAANNASAAAKVVADYVCDGTDDDLQITAALADLPSDGGTIELTAGQFNFGDTVQISRSNVCIRGQGDTTVLFTPWVVGGVPSGSGGDGSNVEYLIRCDGTSEAVTIDNVDIGNFRVVTDAVYDVAPTGLVGNGNFAVIWAQFVNGYNLHDISAYRSSAVADIRKSFHVYVKNVRVKESFLCVNLEKVTNGTVADIIGESVETVVDLSDCDNLTVSGAVGSGGVRGTDEGIDCGGGRNVTITNFALEGFFKGVFLKLENTTRCENITFATGTIRNQTSAAVRVDNVGTTTGNRHGPITISGLNIDSSEANSVGVNMVGYCENVAVTGCVIDVANRGIICDSSIDVLIANNRIKTSSTTVAAVRISQQGAAPVSERCVATANHITGGLYGFEVSQSTEPVVDGNTIIGPTDHGIWFYQCKYPIARNNAIKRCGENGIYLQYANDTWTDSTSRYLNFCIDNNHIQDWATDVIGRRGIHLNITGISVGASYDVGSIRGNTLVVTSAVNAGVQLQNGIRLESTAVPLDYLHITDNMLVNVSYPYVTPSTTIESNCKIKDNIGIADV